MRPADSTTPDGGSDPRAAALADHVSARAGVYFGGAAGAAAAADVRVTHAVVRPTSSLYRFDLRLDGREHRVQVKLTGTLAGGVAAGGVFDSSGEIHPEFARPRIAPVADPQRALRLEHEALSRIHDHFRGLGDRRFGAVRVLEWMPWEPAIVMEMLDEPNLRTLWLGRGGRLDLGAAFHNAGAWLRAYHTMPAGAAERAVQLRREEFTGFVEDLSEFLAHRLGATRYFARVVADVTAAARAHLPEVLPVGLEHGDFAMRNVLVGRAERVTVIDTRSLYRTSIYRDIGYFLGNLRCSVLPALGRGAVAHVARHDAYRQAFLAGYFGAAPVPDVAVHLYELQHLLEIWSAALTRRDAGGRPRLLRRARLVALSAFFRGAVSGRLRALAGHRTAASALASTAARAAAAR